MCIRDRYQYQDETCYRNILGGVTDDGKYIRGIIYTRDESEIKISVFVDEKDVYKRQSIMRTGESEDKGGTKT